MNYSEYYRAQSALENVLPSKREIEDTELPDIVVFELKRLRAMILGLIAELDWEGDE